VDLLLWFLGDVSGIAAHTATLARSIEVEDCVTAALRFESGALGSLAATAASPGFPHRVEIYGTRGGVQIEGESVVRWHGTGSERKPPMSAGPSEAGAGASPTGIAPSGHARIVADFV